MLLIFYCTSNDTVSSTDHNELKWTEQEVTLLPNLRYYSSIFLGKL